MTCYFSTKYRKSFEPNQESKRIKFLIRAIMETNKEELFDEMFALIEELAPNRGAYTKRLQLKLDNIVNWSEYSRLSGVPVEFQDPKIALTKYLNLCEKLEVDSIDSNR